MLLGVAVIVCAAQPAGDAKPTSLLLAASIAAMLVADVVWAHLALSGSSARGTRGRRLRGRECVLLAMSFSSRTTPPDRASARRQRHRASPVQLAAMRRHRVWLRAAHLRRPTWGRRALSAPAGRRALLTALVVARQVIALRENLHLQRMNALRAGRSSIRSAGPARDRRHRRARPRFDDPFVTPSALRVFQAQPRRLVGTPLLDLVHPDDVEDARLRLKESMAAPERALSGALAPLRIATGPATQPNSPLTLRSLPSL